jgi:hypothetical protein
MFPKAHRTHRASCATKTSPSSGRPSPAIHNKVPDHKVPPQAIEQITTNSKKIVAGAARPRG